MRPVIGMVFLLAVLAPPAAGQAPAVAAPSTPAPAAPWRPFAEFLPLLGSWSGSAGAGPRIGGCVAHFSTDLAGTVFVERTTTIFPAEEGKPEETFEDVGYVTYDREKRKYVAAYFFSTGVFGTYDVEILPGGTIRMTAASLANYDTGARSRRVLARRADGTLDLALDVAPPGKDFAPFLSGTLRRK